MRKFKALFITLACLSLWSASNLHAFYAAEAGRWINRDPIGEVGGIDLYRFVANNPVSNTDSFGLSVQYGTLSCPSCYWTCDLTVPAISPYLDTSFTPPQWVCSYLYYCREYGVNCTGIRNKTSIRLIVILTGPLANPPYRWATQPPLICPSARNPWNGWY